MAICWERAVPLAFHLCCFYFSAVLIVGVPFPFGVKGRMWNSIVLVPDHCLFICILIYSFDLDINFGAVNSFLICMIINIFATEHFNVFAK